jgi:hypothetical protein
MVPILFVRGIKQLIFDKCWRLKMAQRSMAVRAFAVVLSFLAVTMTVPFSPADTFSASPLGTIASSGNVTVGNAAAPTGTTIFAGDSIASDSSALISLKSGSRIAMTKAAATLNRQGSTLVVQAKEGLLRFNFIKGENVQIHAGKYTIKSKDGSAHVGELAMNSKGEIAMYVGEGAFTALNNVTGARNEVSSTNPIVTLDQKMVGAAAAGAAVQGKAIGKAEGFIPVYLLVLLIGATATATSIGVYEATNTKSP